MCIHRWIPYSIIYSLNLFPLRSVTFISYQHPKITRYFLLWIAVTNVSDELHLSTTGFIAQVVKNLVTPRYCCLDASCVFFGKHLWCYFSLRFCLGCTCFLLLVCNRTTVCGTPGDAAAYDFAAKNLRWVSAQCLFFLPVTISRCLSEYQAICFPHFDYNRWSLLVGLSWRRPAMHPWNGLWLSDGGRTNSNPNTSFSGRNSSPGIGGPTFNGSGGPADCF